MGRVGRGFFWKKLWRKKNHPNFFGASANFQNKKKQKFTFKMNKVKKMKRVHPQDVEKRKYPSTQLPKLWIYNGASLTGQHCV